MLEENKQAAISHKAPNTSGKLSVRRRILQWSGYFLLTAAMLYLFAPESWWQFGVTSIENRKPAAGFKLKDINGGSWSFEDHRGKVVVVNYWATWCPPCRLETPGLVSFADDYKSRGVETVGVSVDEDLEAVSSFIESYRIKYPILISGHNPNVPADAMPLPTTFLYDKNGRLAKKYTGIVLESTLKSDVEILLAE